MRGWIVSMLTLLLVAVGANAIAGQSKAVRKAQPTSVVACDGCEGGLEPIDLVR
ncbi:MAG: hypothetical protein Kow0054_31320 [Deferrisoma sp.]